jgi:LmbE family N-acetylglucosaminyl deacetylase
MKRNIMVIGAHAGDIEARAGGTLAKYRADGYDGCYVVLTNSNSGLYLDASGTARRRWSEEMRVVRQRQVEAAAGCFGLKPLVLGYKEISYTARDGSVLYPDVATRSFGADEPVGRIPLALAPQVILTGRPCSGEDPAPLMQELVDLLCAWEPEVTIIQEQDLNPDHCAAFLLLVRAFVLAASKAAPGELFCSILHPAPGPYFSQRIDVAAAHKVVDVSGHVGTLEQALRAFEPERAPCAGTVEDNLRRRAPWGAVVRGTHGEVFARLTSGAQIRHLGLTAYLG